MFCLVPIHSEVFKHHSVRPAVVSNGNTTDTSINDSESPYICSLPELLEFLFETSGTSKPTNKYMSVYDNSCLDGIGR